LLRRGWHAAGRAGRQLAKTGTGGHLPGAKVQGKIAQARELPEGQPAISPARFPEWTELRHPADFAKAMALGADGIAVSNAAIQAIGCLGMRACHTNNCPVGIATQKPHLRARLPVDVAAERLARFFSAAVELMTVLSRAAGIVTSANFRSMT
jgi:glutamate synthase domain-containing protein 2